MEDCVKQGLANFLCEGPDGKQFTLCKPHGLHSNCATLQQLLPARSEKEPSTTCKSKGVAVFY